MFFLIPLAPEVIAAAIALASAICTLVTRIGLVHGPRIVELIDVLFLEGIASSAAARQGVRKLAPEVEARLVRQFHDLPNARSTIITAYQILEHALGNGRLYGKEVKAVLDSALHHRFEPSKVTAALREATGGGIKTAQTASGAKGKGHVIVTTGTSGGGHVQTNRQALDLIYIREQRKAQQGSQHKIGMKL